MKISKLKPNPENPRTISKQAVRDAAKSIYTFPQMLLFRKIVYDPEKFVPLGGNVRLLGIKFLSKNLKSELPPPASLDDEKVETVYKALYEEIFQEEYKPFTNSANVEPRVLRLSYEMLFAISTGDFPPDTIISADILTEAQKIEFLLKDNGEFGKWNFDQLANYDLEPQDFQAFGIYIPGVNGQEEELIEAEDPDVLEPEPDERASKWVPDALFESNNAYEIPTLRMDLQAHQIINPVAPWGYSARDAKNIGSYHFYVDDYRFSKVWDKPNQLVNAGVPIAVEPNLSVYDNTPKAYALFQIYKKRWIARYWQSFGVRILVDLNVSYKFYEENLLGVPAGWNAYATRGYADRLEMLGEEYKIAQRHADKEAPFFVVYGGGKKVKNWAQEQNVLYLEQIMMQKFQ